MKNRAAPRARRPARQKFSTVNSDGTWTVWEGTAPADELFSSGTAQHRAPRGPAMSGFFLPQQLAVALPADAKPTGAVVELPVGVVAVGPGTGLAGVLGDVVPPAVTTHFDKALIFARDVAVAVIAARVISVLAEKAPRGRGRP